MRAEGTEMKRVEAMPALMGVPVDSGFVNVAEKRRAVVVRRGVAKSVLEKMQIGDASSVLVLGAPQSFRAEMEAIEAEVKTSLRGRKPVPFALVFVSTLRKLDELVPKVVGRIEPGGKLWFAYPKKGSSLGAGEISRDVGWRALGDAGFEPVRQVAIDADWSALRFRPVAEIGTMTRREGMALSAEGKRRTKGL